MELSTLFKLVIKSYFSGYGYFEQIIEINRKNFPIYVRKFRLGDLDESKLSHKFKTHNLSKDTILNIKCFKDGILDLRGKKQEYRIILEDKNE